MAQDYKYDVVGIGNAIVDVLCFTDDSFLEKQALNKGGMTLVDEKHAAALYRMMGPTTECSGGSVANTLAGIASLGATAAFIGKVKNDQLGAIFTHDLRSAGVAFTSTPVETGPSTANCLIYVTPDAQRTMATYIGACSQVTEIDIEERLLTESAVLYIEGYLWDTENAKAAIRKAIRIARAAKRKVALTLSDTFCVDRHREAFLHMISGDIDILFANEAEVKSLYQTEDFGVATAQLRGACSIAAVTRGESGCMVLTAEAAETVSTNPVVGVIDTTGAGDLFASGFLFGLTRGWDAVSCAQLGNRCAGEIITQMGARSLKPLHTLIL